MRVWRSAYFMSWLVYKAIFVILPTTVFIVSCYAFGVVKYTDPSVLFVAFWLFSLTNIALALLISAPVFNTKSMLGLGIFFLLLYEAVYLLVHFLIIEKDGSVGRVTASFLFSPVAVGHLAYAMADLESYGIGLQWSNVFDHTKYLPAFWYMMPIDLILYMVLAIYVDATVARPAGFPAPQSSWFFFLQYRFWFPKSAGIEAEVGAGVQVEGVKKTYISRKPLDECVTNMEKMRASLGSLKKDVQALEGIDMQGNTMKIHIKHGSIFALLGFLNRNFRVEIEILGLSKISILGLPKISILGLPKISILGLLF